MTPQARMAAAITCLDQVLAGCAAEQSLTNWARGARYAGSGDRAAVRDLVFEALRCQRSFAWRGGEESGRGLMIGLCRARGEDPAAVFTGARFAPEPLRPGEGAAPPGPMPEGVALDMPDWLLPQLRESLGDQLEAVCQHLQSRAATILRVNAAKASPAAAQAALAQEGIVTRPHPEVATALVVEAGPRKLGMSQALGAGLVELQDATSQAVCAALPEGHVAGRRVLDYCAGGGGKALALAARGAQVTAHDASPARMRDIPDRAARAGAVIAQAETAELAVAAPFDLVLCDAPCSGSGAWRRSPEAKWRLSPERLDALCQTQAEILRAAAALTAPEGRLAYATCSVLRAENQDQLAGFLRDSPAWRLVSEQVWLPQPLGDGFYLAQLARV